MLFGLGIRHVGETVAKRLVNHFGSIDTLANASHEELLAVEDIGEKIVESIQAYFSSSQNHQMIQALKEFGLTMELKKTAQLSHQLEGRLSLFQECLNAFRVTI